MTRFYFLLIVFFFVYMSSFCQKKIKGLPEDLDKSKVLFLEFTVRPPGPKPTEHDFALKILYKQGVYLYENLPTSNQLLNEHAKKYPFTYQIIKRSELDEYKSKGFKYVLDCHFFQGIDMGVISHSGQRPILLDADLYLLNLETGDQYVFERITEKAQIAYGVIMDRLIKKVKRAYNL